MDFWQTSCYLKTWHLPQIKLDIDPLPWECSQVMITLTISFPHSWKIISSIMPQLWVSGRSYNTKHEKTWQNARWRQQYYFLYKAFLHLFFTIKLLNASVLTQSCLCCCPLISHGNINNILMLPKWVFHEYWFFIRRNETILLNTFSTNITYSSLRNINLVVRMIICLIKQ